MGKTCHVLVTLDRLPAIFLLCTFPSLMQVDDLSFQAAELKKITNQCNFLTLNILNYKYFPEVILYPQFEPKARVVKTCWRVALLLDVLIFPEVKPGPAQVLCRCVRVQPPEWLWTWQVVSNRHSLSGPWPCFWASTAEKRNMTQVDCRPLGEFTVILTESVGVVYIP